MGLGRGAGGLRAGEGGGERADVQGSSQSYNKVHTERTIPGFPIVSSSTWFHQCTEAYPGWTVEVRKIYSIQSGRSTVAPNKSTSVKAESNKLYFRLDIFV